MKKYLIIIFMVFISIVFSNPSHAQSAKEAVMALEKLDARCQSGISYRDYSSALVDIEYIVNPYLEEDDDSTVKGKHPNGLKSSIKSAMELFKFAKEVWSGKYGNEADGDFLWINGSQSQSSKNIAEKYLSLFPEDNRSADVGGVIDVVAGRSRFYISRAVVHIQNRASDKVNEASKILERGSDKEGSDKAWPNKDGSGKSKRDRSGGFAF